MHGRHFCFILFLYLTTSHLRSENNIRKTSSETRFSCPISVMYIQNSNFIRRAKCVCPYGRNTYTQTRGASIVLANIPCPIPKGDSPHCASSDPSEHCLLKSHTWLWGMHSSVPPPQLNVPSGHTGAAVVTGAGGAAGRVPVQGRIIPVSSFYRNFI